MIAFSFSFVLLAAAGAEASPAPARPFRATHYDAELEIVPATRSVRGVVGIELLGGVDGLGEIDLDCNGLTIDEVSEAGAALAFVQRPALLQISAAKPWRAGERHTLTVRYHGEPRQGLRFFAGGWLTAFNTQGWLPCDGDPAHKATLTLRLIVPAELTVLATGELMGQEPRPDGRQRLTWKLERPHSSYLFGMVAGRFVTSCTTSAGVRVCAAADAAHAGQLAHATAIAGAALPFFAERAGFAFPGTHYDQVFVPSKVAQEMAGLSVMSESYLDELAGDARADWLVLHELIHQWWGNSVTARSWSDLWLNEGITSFLVAAYKEKRWGRVEYEEELALARGSVGKARAAGRRRALASDDWKQPGDMGGPLTYSAGILFMNFLRAELGETAFWAGLRQFTSDAAGGTVTSASLRAAMERASGRDLRAFFDRWVYGADPPLVSARHRRQGGMLIVEVEQRQTPPWPMALRIAVETPGRRLVRDLRLGRGHERFRFRVGAAPVVAVRIDDGAVLPVTVEHERPVAMLLYQLVHEPDVVGRFEALQRLQAACGAGATDPECARLPSVLAEREANEGSRVLREREREQAAGRN